MAWQAVQEKDMALPASMMAMVLPVAEDTLHAMSLPVPQPRGHDVLLAVTACGVCRTDRHVIDRELPPASAAFDPGS